MKPESEKSRDIRRAGETVIYTEILEPDVFEDIVNFLKDIGFAFIDLGKRKPT